MVGRKIGGKSGINSVLSILKIQFGIFHHKNHNLSMMKIFIITLTLVLAVSAISVAGLSKEEYISNGQQLYANAKIFIDSFNETHQDKQCALLGRERIHEQTQKFNDDITSCDDSECLSNTDEEFRRIIESARYETSSCLTTDCTFFVQLVCGSKNPDSKSIMKLKDSIIREVSDCAFMKLAQRALQRQIHIMNYNTNALGEELKTCAQNGFDEVIRERLDLTAKLRLCRNAMKEELDGIFSPQSCLTKKQVRSSINALWECIKEDDAKYHDASELIKLETDNCFKAHNGSSFLNVEGN